MSTPFEQYVARWFHEQVDELDLQDGDRYAAEFPNGETAGAVCEAILAESDSRSMRKVTYEKTSQELPVIEPGSTPLHVVHVRRSGDEVSDPNEVSRWYATTMRNVLAEGQDTNYSAALLMIYEVGVGIETLETTHKLFSDGGRLPLRRFQERIRNNLSQLDRQQAAILRAIDEDEATGPHDTLSFREDPLDDLGPLKTFCKVYDACARQDGDRLPELIPHIGTYLEEEAFDDKWFDKTETEDELFQQAQQILRRNLEHASRIAEAMRVSKDAESELGAYYKEDFIETVLEHRDWTTISRSQAVEGELGSEDPDEDSDGEDTDDDDDTDTTKRKKRGSGTTIDRDPEFDSLSVGTEKSKVYGAGEEARGDRSIVAALTDGSFHAIIEYDIDVSDEPYMLSNSSGDKVDGVECEETKLQISLTGLDPAAPHFFSLKVYVGHKRRQGSPQNQFDLALVPEWFFDALTDDTYAINVEGEALVVRNDNSVSLDPPGGSDEERVVEDLTEQNQSVTLSQPVLLNPDPLPNIERIECTVVASAETPVPVTIEFLSEVEEPSQDEIQLPLSFTAITSPDDWGNEQLQVNSSVVPNFDTGEFHSPNRGRIEIPNFDRKLIQIEQELVQTGTIAQRVTDQLEIGTGKPNPDTLSIISADLIDAYTRLFDHFDERDTTPSTDNWDEETQEQVEAVLEAYVRAVDAIDSGASTPFFNPYRRLGTIRSSAVENVWLTPFHPLMLAYGLRIIQWRDHLVDEGLTEGFRFTRFNALFSPVGLMPYRWDNDSNEIHSGQLVGNNHLWASYTSIEGPGSKTPEYISEVVADKLEAFSRAFGLLFRLHSERELKINLVNMGDLGPVIEGLFAFFKFVDDYPELNFPQITLQLYGGDTEGRALEQFFSTDSADSPLRGQLSGSDRSKEILDHLDQRVTYVHCGEQFDEDTRRPAHLTLFRGLLSEQSGVLDAETFPTATRMEGLLPRDQLEVDSSSVDIVSKSGAAFDPDADDLLSRVGATVNALEASTRNRELTRGRSLSKIITASNQTDLPEIWDRSMWVLHVEPKVDLSFYVRSTSQAANISDDTLMIHYSDQYDADSPGFDVITTTDKRDPYLTALERELSKHPGLDALDPESVLTRLVAIDGELALDLQQSSDNTMELLGLVGGLAVSAEILAKEVPEYEWIPISLNEFARHDRRYRTQSEGLLQYFDEGKASDDLCFIGVPRDGEVDHLSLKLWVVETKGGTSSISKGVEQVQGAVENLTELFDPEKNYADTPILRSEFGDVTTRIANRLYHYDVIDEERLETIQQHSTSLTDGDYTVDILEDAMGNRGEVIRVQRDLYLPETETRDGVRVLQLPVDVLNLINTSPTGDHEIHEELDASSYRFGDILKQEPDSETTAAEDAMDAEVDVDCDQSKKPADSEADDDGVDSERKTGEDQLVDSGQRTGETDDDQSPSEMEDRETGDEDLEQQIESENDEPEEEQDSKPEQTEITTDGDTSRSGYSWTPSDFEVLTASLTESPETDLSLDMSRLTADLKEQFNSLGIDVYEPNPADVSIGPRKIGVNVRPEQGQKIETALNALNSISVHLQASGTITGVSNPAEGAIRLEIPHGEPRDVHIRSGFEELQSTLLEPLHVPLGVNTENEHVAVDLLEEHHMLIGGATGSGKSNFLGTCICSLAASQPPSMVSISLLDPKGIDFGRFEGLPQVDTYRDTPEGCVKYLRKLLEDELEDRREELQDRGVASVQEYNRLAEQDDTEPIQYRVIVIDEFADLIMALSEDQEEFEEAVGRLAQIGRALGYSILLATQRPDANIVSGNIKTNFNCRVSFELPSNTDSRVILDQPGAEDLEGSGDMIVLTSSGGEYHLQAYRLLPEDAITIRDRLSAD